MAAMISSRVGWGFSANRAVAVNIIPGVQKPQQNALWSIKACCTAVKFLGAPSPSMVMISWPGETFSILTTHDLRGVPSIKTVHAPQMPSPHPNLLPVSFRSSRSTQSKGSSGSTLTLYFLPFTFRVNSCLATTPLSPGRY